MSDVIAITEAPQPPAAPKPHAMLESLRPMVGTWKLEASDSSGAEWGGTLRREFMDGGYYLVEHVHEGAGDGQSTGMLFVGYDPTRNNLKGSYYSKDGPGPFGGVALDYVWEVDGREVTIWCGVVGSPAHYTGTFNDDGTVLTGRWVWPGGGYDAVETRIG